ncbi:MAG: bifunctional glutamate N-acetyltransferase/amino-acid acetyltransferase ArgJ [Zavarzinella sp.]
MSIVLPVGYRFGGIHSGLRASEPGRLDLAVVLSESPATAAGVYTQNRVAAAPVQLCRSRTPGNPFRGIVICSGNANACTGNQGLADAHQMTKLMADAAGFSEGQALVCSTGVIGRMLPMPILEVGIPKVVAASGDSIDQLHSAASAILTTDTRYKITSYELASSRLLGFAKGAAMIGPNMATMLGFLFSDANVPAAALQEILAGAVDKTFNCISVEGHTSTNDTVLCLANGQGKPLHGKELDEFAQHIFLACEDLARMIAEDAEGATHLVTIDIHGCTTDQEAKQIAKTVAESALVKTAVYGADPNWGRFVSAAGYAGVPFEETEVSLWMGPFELYRKGTPLPFDEKLVSTWMQENRTIHLKFELERGAGHCRFYTCDLTAEYVRLNADYTT